MLKPNKARINEKAKPTSKFKRIMQAARTYLKRGWKVIPVPGSGKRPVINEWQLEDIPLDYFNLCDNIGVQFGSVSNGLCDVDLDCREARELASTFLPETHSKFGRTSSPCSHWLYYSNAWETAKAATSAYDDPVKADAEHGVRMVELRTRAQRSQG